MKGTSKKKTVYSKPQVKTLPQWSKDRVVTAGKSNIVYEIDWGSCETVYFGDLNRYL